MPTFNIVLDKRVKKKNDQFNLAIRMVNGNDVMYMNITNMTEKQYDQIFIKKTKDENSIQFRETCNGYISKCERLFSELKPFDKKQFRQLFFQKESDPYEDIYVNSTGIENSDGVTNTNNNKPIHLQLLLINDLFDRYISQKELKIKTKSHIRTTRNVLETTKPGLTVFDVTPPFLKEFEKNKKDSGCSIATVNSYLRNLRSVLNHFINEEKVIPKNYEYPFSKGGYSISTYFPQKLVLSTDEIKSVIEYTGFETKEQEYARDIWVFLFRCNGINFADLLRMRWDQIQGNFIMLTRMKTETTRKNNIKQIVVPINKQMRESIDKLGDTNSPFILGELNEGFNENTFVNKSHKMRQAINRNLSEISSKLNLSIPLKLETARDSYATILKRGGKSKDQIGEMLGHSNSVVTEHYLGSLDTDKTFEINEVLL